MILKPQKILHISLFIIKIKDYSAQVYDKQAKGWDLVAIGCIN